MPDILVTKNEIKPVQDTRTVSVVTAFMNEAAFLAQTIETVLAQTFTDWEYILVDDGSSDGSAAIAKKYAASYPGKIFYFEHEGHANKGVCATRNVGISRSKGEYIALLDGDDLWLPQKLEKQVALARLFSMPDMLCEATHYMDKGRNAKVENIDVPVGAEPDKMYYPPTLGTMLYPLGDGDAPCVSSLLIKRNFINSIGGFEESFTGKNSFIEDQAFLFKIYYHGSVYISSLCNNLYRQRPDSSMHRLLNEGVYREGRKYFLQWLKKYMKAQPEKYKELQSLYLKNWVLAHSPRLYTYTYGLIEKFKSKLK